MVGGVAPKFVVRRVLGVGDRVRVGLVGRPVRRVSGTRVCRIGRLRSSIRVHGGRGGGIRRGGSDFPGRLVLRRPNVSCGGHVRSFWCHNRGTGSHHPDARVVSVARPVPASIFDRSPTLWCGRRRHIRPEGHRQVFGRSHWRSPDHPVSQPPRSQSSRSTLPDRRGPRFESDRKRVHHQSWHIVRSDRRPSAADTDRRSPIQDSPVCRPPSRGSPTRPDSFPPRAGQRSDGHESRPGCIGSTTTAPARTRPHPQRMEGWPGGRHDPEQHSITRDTRRSPPPPSPQWPASKSNRSDPDSTHRPRTSPGAEADPPASSPPEPVELQSNGEGQT